MKDITIRLRISAQMKEKLDRDRGSLSMSEYLRGLIGGESVATKVRENVATKESVATEVPTDLEGLKREIKGAIERGDRENWVRVKGLINQAGYSWDFTTKVLLKDGREVWRGYLDNL